MPRDGPKPEYDLVAIDLHDIGPCQAFVQSEADTYNLTHFAGMPISRIMHAIGEDGGWLIEENGAVRAIALAPRFMNRLALLPLPMIHRRAMNRGIQCLLHGVQLIAALHRVSPQDRLAAIAIDYPHDRLPSSDAIHDFGLCTMLPEAHEEAINLPSAALRRYMVAPTLLPCVATELAGLLGRRVVQTDGSIGKAWTYCPARHSPLREGYRWLLDQIAAGRLSVIGLPDISDMRFG